MQLIIKKRFRTGVRKEQIIEAAEKIIFKFGAENLSIRLIADEVGISAGAIYRHFDSKNAIISFLLGRISENLLEDVNKGFFANNGSMIDHLHYTFMNHGSKIRREHAISFQILSEVISLGDKKLNNQLKEAINDYLLYLKNVLKLGIRTGEMREDIDLDSAAMLFFGMMSSISNYWFLNDYKFNLEENMAPMWDVFKNAIMNPKLGNLQSPFKNNEIDSKNMVRV